jgi:hypothetical protein
MEPEGYVILLMLIPASNEDAFTRKCKLKKNSELSQKQEKFCSPKHVKPVFQSIIKG